MLVLLPPSETKASGGDGPPLRLDRLSYSTITPTRRKLIEELVALAADAPAGLAALGLSHRRLSERQSGELERNAGRCSADTARGAALHRRAPRAVSDAAGVARIARRGGLRVQRTGEHALELIVA